MMTRGSMVFRCTAEQAALVADCANLRHEMTEDKKDDRFYPLRGHCEQWQDAQTGGGGCRICWKAGVAWVTRHSGYAWADITEDVSQLFRELGCQEATSFAAAAAHPLVYGLQSWRENHSSIF